MATGGGSDLTGADYRALGRFRYQIRRFLHFSEAQAASEGLEPQQHQMLLAIRALDPDGLTMGRLAEHLMVRHHSAVGLIDRLEERHLVVRERAAPDRREVRVRLTLEGEGKLHRLSAAHRAELSSSGPALVEALTDVLRRLPPKTGGDAG